MNLALRKTALAVSASLLFVSGQALAEDDVVNYLGSLNPALANQTVNFGTTKEVAGSFLDTFNFSFSALAGLNAGAANGLHFQFTPGTPNVDFSQVTLNGIAGTVDNSGAGNTISVFFAGPVDGWLSNSPAYQLKIWGTASAGSQYGGSLNVSVVPEPGSYALMLGGLAGIGMVLRRRRSSTAA